MKILIVEPNRDISFLLEEFIYRNIPDVEVVKVESAHTAAAWLFNEGFHGLVLGSMDDQETLRLSRLAEHLKTKPFVILFSPPITLRSNHLRVHQVSQFDFQSFIKKVDELVHNIPGRGDHFQQKDIF